MSFTFTHPDLDVAGALDALRRAGLSCDASASTTLVVLDTFDGRLAARGLRLEHRRDPELVLVLSDATAAPPARLSGATPPRWPAGLPVGPLRERLASVTKERALLPLLTVAAESTPVAKVDRRGKAVVRGALRDSVVADGAAVEGWFLELAGVVGHDADLERVVERLRSQGFVQDRRDVAAVVAARVGSSIEGRSSSPTVAMDPLDPAPTAYRRVLLNLADTIEANRPGTIDDVDPEFLHELRVAVRRTRSVLSEAKGVLPAGVRRTHREAFGWLGQLTGPARDLDVHLLGWGAYVAPLGPGVDASLARVEQELESRRVAAHAELSAALASERCGTLIDDWRRWLADPAEDLEVGPPVGPLVAKRVRAAQAKVLADGRKITDASDPERLHDLRKDAKRLRYLLECFGSIFPDGERKAFVAQLKELQDNLGEHQDAEVHLAELRALAHDLHGRSVADTDALLAMGRLSDQLDRRRAEERAAFSIRFARYDRPGNRKALERMLRRLEGS